MAGVKVDTLEEIMMQLDHFSYDVVTFITKYYTLPDTIRYYILRQNFVGIERLCPNLNYWRNKYITLNH